MLKLALPIVLLAALAGLVAGSLPLSGASTKKTATKSKRKKSSATPKSATAKKPAARSSASVRRGAKRKPARSWRTGQQQPTPERYREVQQALIGRGYLEAPATGQWGSDSVEALKKFQRDQSLKDSGKLDALSLIALGLGPKRTANPQMGEQP